MAKLKDTSKSYWKILSFLVGLLLIFAGVLNLYYGAYGDHHHPWNTGMGIWCLILGTVDVLLSTPWK